jgi:ribulose-phosphate 3-epimerase
MKALISPSVMCVDFKCLESSIRELEHAQVEYLHIDIMDGRFVPNFTFGPDFVRAIRELTDIPLDFHFMVEEPDRHIPNFDVQSGDIVSIHQEACVHLQRTLQLIRSFGAKCAVALNPATSIYSLEEILDDLDMVLIMTVNPGYAGQKLVPATLNKIRRLKQWLRDRGYDNIAIEVDGNVSFENAVKMREAGADIFVAGTSSIFKKDQNIYRLTEEFRKRIV